MPDALYLGPFPGPVTGQTVITRELHEALADRGVLLEVVNTCRGDVGQAWRNQAIRLCRVVRAIFAILASRGVGRCYVSLDANGGMLFTLLYVLAARARGMKILLHHHSNSHVATRKRVFAVMIRAGGASLRHLVICRTMGDAFARTYPRARRPMTMSNVFSVSPEASERPDVQGRSIIVGFMSNLSFEKGVDEAVASVRHLNASGLDTRLVLAGPVNDLAENYVRRSVSELDFVEWIGPVYGEDKKAFFRSIDFFVFPTRYENETQGVVNLEALAHGIPIVAFDRCCIGEDLAGLDGWLVPPDASFADAIFRLVSQARDGRMGHLRGRATERFRSLVVRSEGELDRLEAWFVDDEGASNGKPGTHA